MKVTVPHEHVHDLYFALAEQVERDVELSGARRGGTAER
jgi:hypothetical protein